MTQKADLANDVYNLPDHSPNTILVENDPNSDD